jgi:guanylate kinase
MSNVGKLFVVSGSSGSGKGTVLANLFTLSDKFRYSISATTRSPREGEKDGVNYFFVSREEFTSMIEKDEMLEYAEFCGNLYGTPKKYVTEQLAGGMNVILEIEVCGAMQIKEKIPEAVLIFITPPSYEELKKRLYYRGTETEEVVEKRLATALKEIKFADKYDYIIINRTGESEKAAKEILAISEGEFVKDTEAETVIRNFI